MVVRLSKPSFACRAVLMKRMMGARFDVDVKCVCAVVWWVPRWRSAGLSSSSTPSVMPIQTIRSTSTNCVLKAENVHSPLRTQCLPDCGRLRAIFPKLPRDAFPQPLINHVAAPSTTKNGFLILVMAWRLSV